MVFLENKTDTLSPLTSVHSTLLYNQHSYCHYLELQLFPCLLFIICCFFLVLLTVKSCCCRRLKRYLTLCSALALVLTMKRLIAKQHQKSATASAIFIQNFPVCDYTYTCNIQFQQLANDIFKLVNPPVGRWLSSNQHKKKHSTSIPDCMEQVWKDLT